MTSGKNIKKHRTEPWRVELRKSMKPKERMAIERTKMSQCLVEERRHSMTAEVNCGFTLAEAQKEAQRCLDCPTAPCTEGCPAHISIPTFIKNIERGEFYKAAHVIRENSFLPAVCSRVCAQEKQCESKCTYVKTGRLSVAIGGLERFVTDYVTEHPIETPIHHTDKDIKIAVVGAGPAGISFAGEMAREGYPVTIFEAQQEGGGVLRYGIPEYRLPKKIVEKEIKELKHWGVMIRYNTMIGRDISLSELQAAGYQYIFIGNGVGKSRMMNIPGENLKGIYSANDFLFHVNTNKYAADTFKGKHVMVVGGGNTAMDTSRTALRLGAEKVTIVYRRSETEMPAGRIEIEEAKEEGIHFLNLHNPINYIANEEGHVKETLLQVMKLSTPDESGRRRPIPIEGETINIAVDAVIVSIGSETDGIIQQDASAPKFNRWGTIDVDTDSQQTSIPYIYAGGDGVRGGTTVVLAMRDGRRAAQQIKKNIEEQKN